MNKRSTKPQKTSTKNQQTGQIRIIAGQHRGRKLPVISLEGLRPTTDRVKETVFNWLMPYLHQNNAIDCFAGAGSLGFEALSRGAQQVTFIELNKAAANQLKQNLITLKQTNAQVINNDCLNYLQQQTTAEMSFDLAFVDPPFRQNLVAPCCQLLDGLLAENAIIYVELEQELTNPDIPANWQCLKQKDAGQVSYRLYQKLS